MDNLLKENQELEKRNELVDTKKYYDQFENIMAIYQKALDYSLQNFMTLKQLLNEYYNYDVISDVTGRLKSPESISGKMKKKNITINYENMIENIHDIAGVRVICSYKDDIYKIINIIRMQKDIKIIKEKDYLKKSKKSGYSAYHIIVEIPIKVKEEIMPIKVEIQIRTVLMDFWATTEHKVKYKPQKKLSHIDSVKLSIYARIINIVSDKMMRIHKKQNTHLSENC